MTILFVTHYSGYYGANKSLLTVICQLRERFGINAFYNVNCRAKRPLWQKAINFIARKIGKKAPFVVKRKVYA